MAAPVGLSWVGQGILVSKLTGATMADDMHALPPGSDLLVALS